MESLEEREQKNVRKVFLWCAPRCTSTAFERTMVNLKGGKIFHEPYAVCYYNGPQRRSLRFANEPIEPKATLEEVSKSLMANYDGKEFIFSKDMAYYLDGHYDVLGKKGLNQYKHSFLIRNPEKSIPSLYRASTNPKTTGWTYFDPEEAGFRQLLELYEYIVKEVDRSPVIIDADDLLESPEEMMKKYCDATGLVYEENMTTWPSAHVPEWDACSLAHFAGWHAVALNSTGLGKAKRKETDSCSFKASDKKIISDCINKSMPCYKVLYEKRLRLKPKTCSNGQS